MFSLKLFLSVLNAVVVVESLLFPFDIAKIQPFWPWFQTFGFLCMKEVRTTRLFSDKRPKWGPLLSERALQGGVIGTIGSIGTMDTIGTMGLVVLQKKHGHPHGRPCLGDLYYIITVVCNAVVYEKVMTPCTGSSPLGVLSLTMLPEAFPRMPSSTWRVRL